MRRCEDAVIIYSSKLLHSIISLSSVMYWKPEEKRPRGRLGKRLIDVVEKDLKTQDEYRIRRIYSTKSEKVERFSDGSEYSYALKSNKCWKMQNKKIKYRLVFFFKKKLVIFIISAHKIIKLRSTDEIDCGIFFFVIQKYRLNFLVLFLTFCNDMICNVYNNIHIYWIVIIIKRFLNLFLYIIHQLFSTIIDYIRIIHIYIYIII